MENSNVWMHHMCWSVCFITINVKTYNNSIEWIIFKTSRLIPVTVQIAADGFSVTRLGQ